MKKRFVSLVACGVLAAGAVAGFTGCSEDSLTVWGSAAQQETLRAMVEEFKKANPDLEYNIKVGICEEEWAYSNVSKDPSAAADVYCYSNDQLIPLLRCGGLAELGGQFLETVKTENSSESVASGSVGWGTGNEKVYGYPYASDNGYFMFYDKSVVTEEQAKTLEGIIEACSNAGKNIGWALDTPWYTAGWFFTFGCTYNVEYDDKYAETSVSIDFDGEGGVKASKAMAKLTSATFANDSNKKVFAGKNTSNTTIIDGFSDHSMAVAVSGTWNANKIKELLGENYGVCALPTVTVDSETKQLYSFKGYKLFGVNPHSKDLVTAHKLAAFLSSGDMQEERFEKHLVGPTNTVVSNLPAVVADPAIQALNAQNAFAKEQTSVPSNFWEPIKTYALYIIDGLATEANYQSQLKTAVDQIRNSVTNK